MGRDVRGFPFDSGRVALDLMATRSGHGSSAPIERLPDPADLERWLCAAGLACEATGVTADDLADARRLRSLLFDVVGAVTHDRPIPRAAIEELNRFAARPVPAPRLGVVGGELRNVACELQAAAALAAIARDAVDLLIGQERALLRECEAEDCSGIYVDRSHGRRRRWCSTARCGNRARVAAHRARHRPSSSDERRD